MKLLEGKKGIITGVVNHRSIAWAISELFHQEGAEVALTYAGEGKWVRNLGSKLGISEIHPCDVADEYQMQNVCTHIGEKFRNIDYFVHSIAYTPEKELAAGVIGTSREGFLKTMEISVYSLIGFVRYVTPYLSQNSSIITLSYLGANRVCAGYHVMGMAKAALECTSRYLAEELGKIGVRSNVISAGPIRTLAGLGIPNLSDIVEKRAAKSPLKSNITQRDAANTALYLASDLSSLVTGQIIYVDAGYHIMGTWTEENAK